MWQMELRHTLFGAPPNFSYLGLEPFDPTLSLVDPPPLIFKLCFRSSVTIRTYQSSPGCILQKKLVDLALDFDDTPLSVRNDSLHIDQSIASASASAKVLELTREEGHTDEDHRARPLSSS